MNEREGLLDEGEDVAFFIKALLLLLPNKWKKKKAGGSLNHIFGKIVRRFHHETIHEAIQISQMSQPEIILVGTKYYVVVLLDALPCPGPSFLEAVEHMIKVVYAFDLKYSDETRYCFAFIERMMGMPKHPPH